MDSTRVTARNSLRRHWLLLTCGPAASWSVESGLDEVQGGLLLDARRAWRPERRHRATVTYTGRNKEDIQMFFQVYSHTDGRASFLTNHLWLTYVPSALLVPRLHRPALIVLVLLLLLS